jgi:hypothetical protein
MKHRDAVLAFQETQSSDASTKTIDLDLTDPISAIAFEFQAQNGSTSNQNNPLTQCVTKLEVVDGSDVLFSMPFEECQALQFYKTGKQPFLRIDETASDYTVMGCMILFGRYLWDRQYALDPTKYANLQLKITWNLAAIRAVSATTAWATGTFKLTAVAKVMEGMAAPGNFFMGKLIESWTGGTSGDKRSELPIDYIIRMIMLRTYYTVKDVDENLTNIKLTCDTDKFIPFDRNTKQWDAEMAQLFGNIVMWKRVFATTGDQVWVPLNKEPQVKLIPVAADVIAYYSWCWSGEFYLGLEDYSSSAISSDTELHAEVEGHALHATVPIPMGVMDEPDTWFDPTEYKKVELVMTEAVAAANSIVVEQVRPN